MFTHVNHGETAQRPASISIHPNAHAQLVCANDICALIGISRATLYRMINDGEFPKPFKFGSASRWPLAAVDDLLKRKASEVQ